MGDSKSCFGVFGVCGQRLCVLKSFLDKYTPDRSPLSWEAPCSGCLKINCDGAFFPDMALGAAAFIVRDSCGSLVDGNAVSFPCPTPQFAEARAVSLAVEWVSLHGDSNCIIETNCQRFFLEIVDLNISPRCLGASLVFDIRSKVKSLLGVVFHFVGRQGNHTAHWFASAQKSAALSAVWKSYIPLALAAILSGDLDPLGIGWCF